MADLSLLLLLRLPTQLEDCLQVGRCGASPHAHHAVPWTLAGVTRTRVRKGIPAHNLCTIFFFLRPSSFILHSFLLTGIHMRGITQAQVANDGPQLAQMPGMAIPQDIYQNK